MIELDRIRIDGGTQSRVQINQETVAEYAEAYRDGTELPPITLYFDGTHYWLADGFHRFHAAREAGLSALPETVTPGTLQDALVFALGANGKHGLRRTNADKRHAVNLALANPDLAQRSDSELARICSVSHSFVGTVRHAILNRINDDNGAASSETPKAPSLRTVTRNGISYQQNTARIGVGKRDRAEDCAEASPHNQPSELDRLKLENEQLHREIRALLEENATLHVAVDGEAAAKEIRGLKAQLAAAESQRDDFMRQSSEMKREIKYLRRMCAPIDKNHAPPSASA